MNGTQRGWDTLRRSPRERVRSRPGYALHWSLSRHEREKQKWFRPAAEKRLQCGLGFGWDRWKRNIHHCKGPDCSPPPIHPSQQSAKQSAPHPSRIRYHESTGIIAATAREIGSYAHLSSGMVSANSLASSAISASSRTGAACGDALRLEPGGFFCEASLKVEASSSSNEDDDDGDNIESRGGKKYLKIPSACHLVALVKLTQTSIRPGLLTVRGLDARYDWSS